MNPKSDLDFDELDKAVSSLMGKVGDETLEDGSKTKELAINSTLQPTEQPKYDALGDIAKTIGHDTLVTDAEIELTADLDKTPEASQAAIAASIPALTRSPAPLTQPSLETPPTAPEVPPVVPVADAAPKPPQPLVPRPNKGRVMDVSHPSAGARPTTLSPPQVAPPRPQPAAFQPPAVEKPAVSSQPPEPVAQQIADIPITTPFLPSAKVEKRPLGSVATPPDGVAKDIPQPAPESEAGSEEPQPQDNNSGDSQRVLNAEDFAHDTSATQELQKVEMTEEDSAHQLIQSIESNDAETTQKTDTPADASEIGAIYDTKQYHQPLNHPAKQKSGWGVVAIIVVIIVLAVVIAGGAYLYFGL